MKTHDSSLGELLILSSWIRHIGYKFANLKWYECDSRQRLSHLVGYVRKIEHLISSNIRLDLQQNPGKLRACLIKWN